MMKIETEHLEDDESVILEIIRRVSSLENELIEIQKQIEKNRKEIDCIDLAVQNLGGY